LAGLGLEGFFGRRPAISCTSGTCTSTVLHATYQPGETKRIREHTQLGNRGEKEGRHTEEDEGEDEGDGEDREDEKDDGELRRSRQAAARHGAGGSSVPALQGGDPLARLLGLWHAGPAELLGASKSLVAVAAPVFCFFFWNVQLPF